MDSKDNMDKSGMNMDMHMGGMQMYMYWNTKVTFLIKGNCIDYILIFIRMKYR